MKAWLWACALACVTLAAHADDIASARACTGIADSIARLSCFDAAFAAREPGSAAVSDSRVPSPAASVSPIAAFGDRGQRLANQAVKPELPKRINYRVTQAESLAGGLFRLTMDNGQIWATKETDWALQFDKGDEVTIQRMVMGGYRVSHIGKGRNVTVARIQ